MKTHNGGKALLKSMEFTTLIPVSRNSIPLGRGRGHGQSLQDMKVVKEIDTLLTQVVKSGIAPYEVATEIDVNNAEIKAQKSQRKSFTQSFRALLKDKVKAHGLDGKIDVREYNKGERFFLVGRAA